MFGLFKPKNRLRVARLEARVKELEADNLLLHSHCQSLFELKATVNWAEDLNNKIADLQRQVDSQFKDIESRLPKKKRPKLKKNVYRFDTTSKGLVIKKKTAPKKK